MWSGGLTPAEIDQQRRAIDAKFDELKGRATYEAEQAARQADAQTREAAALRERSRTQAEGEREAARTEAEQGAQKLRGIDSEILSGRQQFNLGRWNLQVAYDQWISQQILYGLALERYELGSKFDIWNSLQQGWDLIISAFYAASSRLAAATVGQFGGNDYARRFEPRSNSDFSSDQPPDYQLVFGAWQNFTRQQSGLEEMRIGLERQQVGRSNEGRQLQLSIEASARRIENGAQQMHAQSAQAGRAADAAHENENLARERERTLEEERRKARNAVT